MGGAKKRHRRIIVASVALLCGVAAGATQIRLGADADGDAGTDGADAGAASPGLGPTRHPIVISAPAGPPPVDTGRVDAQGNTVTASCTTCHATRPPDPSIDDADALDEFHQGLTYAHGTLACMSCHDPGDYDALRLANGDRLEYPRVMELCAQCHGTQARDYRYGAHGGMNGYWDLTPGPRRRNGCIDCHDPHAPAFPRMRPTFKPNDRFLSRPGSAGPEGEFRHE